MLDAILLSFAVIFVAEFADKSQLVAFGFATRYRAVTVLGALLVANSLTQALSVLVGAGVGHLLPAQVASVAAGLVMFAFAAWTWRQTDEHGSDPGDTGSAATRTGFVAMIGAVMLAELGDKTMFATVALAAAHNPVGIWIGATLGMTGAGAVAVIGARAIAGRLRPTVIRVVTAAAFTLAGVVLIVGAMLNG
jgi:Ca2+/H+ antiporter, TMEM165/GDT1 family